MRQAKIREMKERRERSVKALIGETDTVTKEVHSNLMVPSDDGTDEEGSMDFLDLAMRDGLQEGNSELELMFEAMCDISQSHQIY